MTINTTTSFRLCSFNNRVCICDTAEMQPCVAGLIENYLDEIRSALMTGEEDQICMWARQEDLRRIFRTFPTLDALHQATRGGKAK
jgi:hypothetical protein